MIDADRSALRRIALTEKPIRWKGVEQVLVPLDLLERITRDWVVETFHEKPPRCSR